MGTERSPDGVRVLLPQQIAPAVRRVIEEAREELILVSPYFKPYAQLMTAIERACRNGAHVSLVVRSDQAPKIEPQLAPCHAAGVTVVHVDRIHAKLYVNERTAILTSLNLVDASAQEAWEAGVAFEAEGAPEHYDKVRNQAIDAVDEGTALAPPGRAARRAPARTAAAAGRGGASAATNGTCLRCGKGIRFDPEKPLCLGCYGKWKKYANPDYAEKHCHGCGREGQSSVAKPLCRSCFMALAE